MAEKKTTSVQVSLREIQAHLNAPKGQFNGYGKYKYRSCEDILAAVKPLLAANNCTLIIADDILLIGNRFYVKATATLTGADGDTIVTTAYAREEENKKGMDASQVTGAASSYARKYALNGLFAIDDTKDADALNVNAAYTQPVQPDANRVAEAIAKVQAAKTSAEVKQVFSAYADLKNVKDFYDLVISHGKELAEKERK